MAAPAPGCPTVAPMMPPTAAPPNAPIPAPFSRVDSCPPEQPATVTKSKTLLNTTPAYFIRPPSILLDLVNQASFQIVPKRIQPSKIFRSRKFNRSLDNCCLDLFSAKLLTFGRLPACAG